ncbi:hypothetical protein EMCRGX_G032394, partial [Ephydatia muelleri]
WGMATLLLSSCPLLLPFSSDKLSYRGYISIGAQHYRLNITVPRTLGLKHARLECDWKLKHTLHGFEGLIQRKLEQSRDVHTFVLEFKDLVSQVLTNHPVPLQEPPPPPVVYSQFLDDLDAIGWEKVVHIDPSFRDWKISSVDSRGREHILSLHLSPQHPTIPPICNASLPYPFQLQWHSKASLQDLVIQFGQELCKYQRFWDTMDQLDQETLVLEPERPTRENTQRRIMIGQSVSLVLLVDPLRPGVFPQCKFLGPDHAVSGHKARLSEQIEKWEDSHTVLDNLERILGIKFPSPSKASKETPAMCLECGICYMCRLDGAAPEVTCNNPPCSRSFHHACLFEWLKGLPTSRQSFKTVFGECPYCGQPITVTAAP